MNDDRYKPNKNPRISQDTLDLIKRLSIYRETYNDTLQRVLKKYNKMVHNERLEDVYGRQDNTDED